MSDETRRYKATIRDSLLDAAHVAPPLLKHARRVFELSQHLKRMSNSMIDDGKEIGYDKLKAAKESMRLTASELRTMASAVDLLIEHMRNPLDNSEYYRDLLETYNNPYSMCSKCQRVYSRRQYDVLIKTSIDDTEICDHCGGEHEITQEYKQCICGSIEFQTPNKEDK